MNFFFPDIFDQPAQISFAQQEPDEKIELLLRAHWVTNLPWLFSTLLLLMVPTLVYSLGPTVVNFALVPIKLQISFVILWYLFILAYVIEKFLFWYFNIYIITDKHLVDIGFNNLLNRDKVEAEISDVQSAKASIKGIFGSLFNYGDLTIKTSADRQDIVFSNVPKPDFVADRIQDIQTRIGGK